MVRSCPRVAYLAVLTLAVATPSAFAQAARDSRMQVTVVDPSGGVIPDATVTIVGLEPATQAVTVAPAKTDERGIAVLERVPPGRYSISAEFPGFDLGLLRDIRVRAGENRHVVVLPLQKLEDSVVVGRDAQEAAADRRATEPGLDLSRELIESLSDDPDELQRQLQELSGPDTIVRVDSFEGQQLPPKAQIKSIRVTRDQFAAETANPGSTVVDIITQPGVGALRGGLNLVFRDGSMSGRSRFTDRRGPEQVKDVNGNIGGTLIPGKTTFSLSVNSQNQYTTPVLNALLPEGRQALTLSLRQPFTSLRLNGLVDQAITRDQVLRIGIDAQTFKRENLGVGQYNLPERAFTFDNQNYTLRVQEAGPLGRRAFINTRAFVNHFTIGNHAAVEKPTIVVQDTFTVGGAQQDQDASAVVVNMMSDVDYVRGIHSWRGGVQVDYNRFQATSRFNYLGTYTFSDLEAYVAGRPMLYTRLLGTPHVQYYNLQYGVYFQDDIRLRRGLTLSPGVRYSTQTRVNDRSGIEPRFGFTWSPRADGATTLRGSVGLFHTFLPIQFIEQSLRLNGTLQRDIYLNDPALLQAVYPGDPDVALASAQPTSKYVIDPDNFKLGRNLRYSAGIDQALSPLIRVNALYNYIHLQQQARGRNLNPLVNGIRPDPAFANVIEAVTDTEIRRHELFLTAILNFVTPSPALNAQRVNWRRVNLNVNYSVIRARNNSGGFFEVSPSENPEDDWGPGPADQPYRLQVLLTSTQIRNLTMAATFLTNAGFVYNWITGFDDNADGIINDRPAGVGLRTLRGDRQQTLNVRVAYDFRLGGAGAPEPGAQARYRFNVFAAINNVTNHQNLANYSGNQRSLDFGQATAANNLRRVDLGMGVTF